MGRWIVNFLIREGYHVIASDLNKEELLRLRSALSSLTIAEDNREAVIKADIIVIAVPIESFEDVVKEIRHYVRERHLIMDICSVKEEPVKIMHELIERGTKLGTHPLFGPGASTLKGKKVVLTPINLRERDVALRISKWLRAKGAQGLLMSPTEHDKYMRVVLGLTHFVGLSLIRELSEYELSKLKELGGPTFNLMLTFAMAILAGNIELYVSLQKHLNTYKVVKNLITNENELLKRIENEPEIVVQELLELRRKLAEGNIDFNEAYKRMYRLFEENS